MTMHGNTSEHAASLASPRDEDGRGADVHSVQFYEDDAVLLDELSRFIGSALGAGDAGVVIATPEHRGKLAERLTACGLDLALATRQGRYVALDASEVMVEFLVDGWPDPARFDDSIGGIIARARVAAVGERPRVAVFGEMVALLWAEGRSDAALRLEQLWNDLARSHAFSLRCAYPMRFFNQAADGKPLERVCAEHAQVIPVESYTVLPDDDARLRAIASLQQKAQALETELEERKQLEQELRQALAARDDFLSVAAHELRTPVTTLRLAAQTTARRLDKAGALDPSQVRRALEIIDEQSVKLAALVGQLLDVARLKAGKLTLERTATNLGKIGRDVVAVAPVRAADQVIAVRGPDMLLARVDPLRVEQVIANLVDNALKYSPADEPIEIFLCQPSSAQVQVTVRDHGSGILPEHRDHIFDRFYQANADGHRSGMGLGLFVSQQIAQAHGGTITAEFPDDGGTRFVLTLPAT